MSNRVIHPYSLRNLTKRTLTALFPVIPEKSVRHRHLLIAGLPESGKTILVNYLAKNAIMRYGTENVNLIPVNVTADCYDLMDTKPVQMIIIDDAIKGANSRLSGRNAGDVSDFMEIRHEYEKRARRENGVVITIYISQRFKSLDIVFRSAHAIIFKTVAVDPDDSKAVRKYIGKDCYDYLQNITNRIYYEADDSAKSESVVCLTFANRSGSFEAPYVAPILNFRNTYLSAAGQIGTKQTESFQHNEFKLLEKYQRRPGFRLPAKIYYYHHVEHKTYDEISSMKDVEKSVADCKYLERKMRGEMSRVIGEQYESWKAQDLEKRGWIVKRGGGIGEADIEAVNAKGLKLIFSCKCLRYDRRYKMDIQEIRPEINRALKEGCAIVLSVFNLYDNLERETSIEPGILPNQIILEYKRKAG